MYIALSEGWRSETLVVVEGAGPKRAAMLVGDRQMLRGMIARDVRVRKALDNDVNV